MDLAEKATIAVCIIFFNKAEQTVECIESFARADVPIYVLNNGSSPSSAEIVAQTLRRWPRVKLLHAGDNLGAAGGRNKLIETATEDWLFFIDNDITVKEETWLQNLENHIRYSRGVDILVPEIHNIWNYTLVRPAFLSIDGKQAKYENPGSDFTNLFPGGGALINKSVFARYGCYDADLRGGFEDFELALRALLSGKSLVVQSIHDVTLLHDHRYAATEDDQTAVFTRYDVNRIAQAHNKVLTVYGIALDPGFEPWAKEQIREMTALAYGQRPARDAAASHFLFCCEFYYPSRGGVQEVMRQIAEHLVKAGHQVTVATTRLAEREFVSYNGVAIEEFTASGNLVNGLTGEIQRYQEFLKIFPADAILINAAQQWTFDAALPVLDAISARKVCIPCGFSGLFRPEYHSYFERMPDFLRKFDHLIFHAGSYRDIDFAREHNLSNYSIVPNGASEEEFLVPPRKDFRASLGIAEDDFFILTVGAPISSKGHAELAAAFSLLRTRRRLRGRLRRLPVALILNGDWPPEKPIATVDGSPSVVRSREDASDNNGSEKRPLRTIDERIAAAHAQGRKMVLKTSLSREDTVQAFLAADLFVFASNIEYSPLVLFEAAAAGTPFITVPVGNSAEIVKWTGGGVLCPAPVDEAGFTRVDPAVLAKSIETMITDAPLRRRLGEAGRRSFREKFCWRLIAKSYEKILSAPTTGPADFA
jgi:glycosyltransferase involved in cell wall biosynthesis/GT2 family glycosyltransferase